MGEQRRREQRQAGEKHERDEQPGGSLPSGATRVIALALCRQEKMRGFHALLLLQA